MSFETAFRSMWISSKTVPLRTGTAPFFGGGGVGAVMQEKIDVLFETRISDSLSKKLK